MVDQPYHDGGLVFKRQQFSILTMLGITTVVALISVRNSFWGTIFAIQIIAVYLFITFLIGCLPNELLNGMNANCLRQDGTIDQKRLDVERNQLKRLFWELLLVITVVFLVPITWTLWHF